MNSLKIILLFLFGLIIFSCNDQSSMNSSGSVKYVGALKNIMRKGDLATKLELSDLKDSSNLYALGAIADLKGEIQIFDGVPYNSFLEGDSLIIDDSFDKEACLLVYSQIDSWDTVNIPDSLKTRQELEYFILLKAKEFKLDHESAFPFLLEGSFKSIDWHVIDWKDGDTEHSHEKHIQSGLNGVLQDTIAQMLGFYSSKHKGVFTHHTANTHIHFKLSNNRLAGHVDNLELNRDLKLKLPKAKF